MNKIAAIYIIVNKINHKIYLGSTCDFANRKRIHIYSFVNNRHSNKHLQRAWDKYGSDNFTIFPIEEFSSISGDALVKKEASYIKKFNLTEVGYNIQEDPSDLSGKNNPNYGNHNPRPSTQGKKRPQISRKMVGKNNPMYGRIGKLNPMYGVLPSNKGKKHSLESRRKMRGPRPNMEKLHLLLIHKKNRSIKRERDSMGRFIAL